MELEDQPRQKIFDRIINRLRHILIVSSSVILILIGIIGILLPIMPGIPFLILGLMLWYREDAKQIKQRIIGLNAKLLAAYRQHIWKK